MQHLAVLTSFLSVVSLWKHTQPHFTSQVMTFTDIQRMNVLVWLYVHRPFQSCLTLQRDGEVSV